MTRDLHSAILFCAFLSSKSASNTQLQASACTNARPIFSTLFQTSKERNRTRVERLFRSSEFKTGHVKTSRPAFFDKSYIPHGYPMKCALKTLKRAANSSSNSPAFLHPKLKNMRRHVRYHRSERRSGSSSRYITQPILESLLRRRTIATDAATPKGPVIIAHGSLQPSKATVGRSGNQTLPVELLKVIMKLDLDRLACDKDVTGYVTRVYPVLSWPSGVQGLFPPLQIRLCLALLLSAFQLSPKGGNFSPTDSIDSQGPGSYAWTLAQARAVWNAVDPNTVNTKKYIALYHMANAQLLAFEGRLGDAMNEAETHATLKDALDIEPSWLVLQTHRVIFVASLLHQRPLTDTILSCLRTPNLSSFLSGNHGISTLSLTRTYGDLLQGRVFEAFDQLQDPHAWYAVIEPKSPHDQEAKHNTFSKKEHQQLCLILLHYLVNRLGAIRSIDSTSTATCNPASTLIRMFDTLDDYNYPIPNQLRTQSSLELNRFGYIEDAEEIAKSTSDMAYQTSANLAIAAKQGDVLQALDLVATLRSIGSLHKRDIRQLLLAYVRAPVYEIGPVGGDSPNGDPTADSQIPDRIQEAEEIFIKLLAPHGPSKTDYTIILDAYSRRGDVGKVNAWIGRMLDDGFQPDDIPWESALRAFAFAGNVDGVVRMLDHLEGIALRRREREADGEQAADTQHRWSHVMNINVFNILLELMAKRRDPLSANRLWRNVAFGGLVEPNFNSAFKLMRAHAEAGHWNGVIKAWKYLETQDAKQDFKATLGENRMTSVFNTPHQTTAVYNVALRAYIALGTPLPTVMNLFHKMRSSGITPDSFTYTMVIISATDAGDMDTAMSLFEEMDQQEAHKGLLPTGRRTIDYRPIYALTYLLWGYLRLKNWPKARKVYQQIEQRGLKLLPLTFAVITKSYMIPGARGNDDEGLKVAENFLRTLRSGWGDPPPSEGDAPPIKKDRPAHDVAAYSALMVDFVRQRKPEEVERMFEQMLQMGGDASITGLTMLMDVYRRVGDVNGVRETWRTVLQLAKDALEKDELARQISSLESEDPESPDAADLQQYDYPRSSRALLCYPFSIFMDAVSAVGSHDEVALEWKRLRDAGFSFDSHNWNHLVTVLVRAGEVERAFEVVEGVIIPFALSSKQLVSGSRMPWEMPGRDKEDRDDDDNNENNQPLVDEEKVRWGRRRVSAKFESSPARRATLEMLGQELATGSGSTPSAKDFVHELWLMQSVSLNWYQWKPHRTVLRTLAKVLDHLESGRPVLPVPPPGVQPEQVEGSNEEAHVLWEKLQKKYPRTCRLAYHQIRRGN